MLFEQELAERECVDVLDRALLRAEHNKINGAITAPEYWKVTGRIESLKKLKITSEYEKLQDKTAYEWMKYKVAAEVGGPEEVEAFKLYEQVKIEEKGEEKYRLFANTSINDPVMIFLR